MGRLSGHYCRELYTGRAVYTYSGGGERLVVGPRAIFVDLHAVGPCALRWVGLL